MADLAHLSDAELDSLVKKKLDAGVHPDGLENMSDADIDRLVLEKSNNHAKSLGDYAADTGNFLLENVVAPVGRTIDRFTGAPTRTALQAGIQGHNPIIAFASQFGRDPSLAPTGKEIASGLGVPETSLSDIAPSLYSVSGEGLPLKKGGIFDPTASGTAGLGIDIAADVGNFVPAEAISSVLGKATSRVSKGTGKAVKFVASQLSGIPEKDIETYAKRTDEINKLIKESGGDVSVAADQIRGDVQRGIQSAKGKLNNEIKASLSTFPTERTFDIAPVIEKLESAKSSLNKNYKGSAIQEIDDMIASIKADNPGNLANAQSLNEAKKFLQDNAQSAYIKNGQIFTRAGEAANAARDAGALARRDLNKIAPIVRDANDQLSRLHRIESTLNKNLITPGKSDAALLAAGSGTNTRNSKMLQRLGEIAGVDALGGAENLSSAKQFANPGLLPVDFTGKAVARQAAAGVAGGVLGGPIAAIAAALATSPASIKKMIQAKSAIGKILPEVSPEILKNIDKAAKAAQVISVSKQNSDEYRKKRLKALGD